MTEPPALTPEVRPPTDAAPAPTPCPDEFPPVAGHRLTPPQWKAFRAYHLGKGTNADRIRAAIVAAESKRATIYRWTATTWWSELYDRFVSAEQKAFHADLIKLHGKAVDGLKRVFDGDELPKGGAGAIVQGAALLTKLGEKPLQDSRNLTTINNNTLDNRGIVVITGKTIDDITDAETMMKLITGEAQLESEEET